MDSNNSIAKKYKHLNLSERIKIEIYKNDGLSLNEIAKKLGRNKSTISREIKRNQVKQLNSDLSDKLEYYGETAQIKYENKRKNSGRKIKLVECSNAIKYIENKILKEKWSPDAAVGRFKLENKEENCVSTKTVYNYIDLGLMKVKPIDLLFKVKLKNKRKIVKKNKRILGQSIEKRAASINDREEVGHWEIDTVLGQRRKSSVLMTLTERKTRMEMIVKIPSKTSQSVQQALLDIKKSYAGEFDNIFKSITCDNGSEFNFNEDFKSQIDVELFYSHPYSSFERGTNENHNGIIRRFIPKGKSIDDVSNENIERVCYWINTLPRKILNYKTPLELFSSFVA